MAEHGTKPLPPTASEKFPVPITALDGESDVMTGVGSALGAAIVKGDESEVAVGVDTVMFTVPGRVMSASEISAVSCVALTNVVGRGEPFQFTTRPAPFAKSVPITVSVKPATL